MFDPAEFVAALDEDGLCGPEEDLPTTSTRFRTSEDETWARTMRKIIADPSKGWRRLLFGDAAMAERLRAATETAPHFAAVTGIVERAILTSAAARVPIRFPPVLMLSEPGLGKTHYARSLAAAIGTRAVPIALNATSDRGQLGGSSPAWRGARVGRLAKAILLECGTASPLFSLDEIDKTTKIAGEDVGGVLLNALEPENARSFVDEHLDLPIRLDHALWLASANDASAIAPALLSRMLVLEVPWPTAEQNRLIVRSVAKAAVPLPIEDDAVDLLCPLNARRVRQTLELAYPFAVCGARDRLSADDVRHAMSLANGAGRRAIGFTKRTP